MTKDDAPFSHDQNFKKLLMDYPKQCIEFFARELYPVIEDNPTITPLRQEQQKSKLSKHHRELDMPLLLEWPDGRRAITLFAFEQETNPYKFNVAPLAHYCLDLAEQYKIQAVVPVVIFLNKGRFDKTYQLKTQQLEFLHFRFLYCHLAALHYKDWQDSDNIVARINLVNMQYKKQDKVHMFHKSSQGLFRLENDESKQSKYLDFIDGYAKLDAEEYQQYQQQYPDEEETMLTLSQRNMLKGREMGREEGLQEGLMQGLEKGLQKGQLLLARQTLQRMLKRRFGELAPADQKRIENAELNQLEQWIDNFVDAKSVEQVFQ